MNEQSTDEPTGTPGGTSPAPSEPTTPADQPDGASGLGEANSGGLGQSASPKGDDEDE